MNELRTPTAWIATAWLCACLLSACQEGESPASDATTADTLSSDTPSDDTVEADGVADTAPGADTGEQYVAGPSACCLSLSEGVIYWADEGDIYSQAPAEGDSPAPAPVRLIDHAATQTDPTVADGVLVWADDRDGDFDIWMWRLGEPLSTAAVLVAAAGDQRHPSLAGDVLVWVDRRRAPHSPRESEIWMLDLADPDATPVALTDDAVEQDDPHTDGLSVVWSDYTNSADGVYRDLTDPALNNADIRRYTIATGEYDWVTTEGTKQLRPAVDGDTVVWLDWRGINPEPKYAEFQVFAAVDGGPEQFVAWSGWEQPLLWRRPAVDAGMVAWIGESSEGVELPDGATSGVFTADLTNLSANATLVRSIPGVLEAVALESGRLGILGDGLAEVRELAP